MNSVAIMPLLKVNVYKKTDAKCASDCNLK